MMELPNDVVERLIAHMDYEDGRSVRVRNGELDQREKKWYTGRELPVALLAFGLALIGNTVGIVWWAATINAQVVAMKEARAGAIVVQAQRDAAQDTARRDDRADIMMALNRLSDQIGKIK